jgi:carbamoyl-phosphate synthase small subunit
LRLINEPTAAAFAYGLDKSDKALKIVVLDCGAKYSILRIMCGMSSTMVVVPCTCSAEEILSLKPDGILLSPGPGNPELLDYVVSTIKKLVGKKPIMGICLGNQLIARTFGASTFKLKFGHHGGNHPVKNLQTTKVDITSQNHGFAVDIGSLDKRVIEPTHVNLNDNTNEGMSHKELPIFSVQYHPEASPGPHDSRYLFRRSTSLLEENTSNYSPSHHRDTEGTEDCKGKKFFHILSPSY